MREFGERREASSRKGRLDWQTECAAVVISQEGALHWGGGGCTGPEMGACWCAHGEGLGGPARGQGGRGA